MQKKLGLSGSLILCHFSGEEAVAAAAGTR